MLMKICRNRIPHWVQDEIDAFSPGKFCCRHEICITSNEDDLIDLTLESQRSDIESDLHVYTFLTKGVEKVVVSELGDGNIAGQQGFEGIRLHFPSANAGDVPKSKCYFPLAAKLVVQFESEYS